MKKLYLAIALMCSLNAFSQTTPEATYDGGSLYFIPAKLTSQNVAYLYSYNSDFESGKTWFTVFDSDLNVIKQAEIEPDILNYQIRTITYQRRYFKNYVITRSSLSQNADEGYFLDEWTEVSDITEDKSYKNRDVKAPEIYEDDNSYQSRYMYLSQTLFNDDNDFEFLRYHYEVIPITHCSTDDNTPGHIYQQKPNIGGEEYDFYDTHYDYQLGGNVTTLYRVKEYGGVKITGTDIISLDGKIKKSLDGITDFNTVVAIGGKYYVSAYDWNTSKYGLYKIATTSKSLSKVKDLTGETGDNKTYNLSGIRVDPCTKGIVIRNGRTFINK